MIRKKRRKLRPGEQVTYTELIERSEDRYCELEAMYRCLKKRQPFHPKLIGLKREVKAELAFRAKLIVERRSAAIESLQRDMAIENGPIPEHIRQALIEDGEFTPIYNANNNFVAVVGKE